MVKWKKMNKKMAGLLLGVMMLFTTSTTAFAYVDESAEASKVETTQTEQSTDKEEKKDEATNTNEVLPEDGTDKGTAFTTPGNGEVKDDITDDSTKEFLTVTTKNNNTFYIVIDRSATSQNVYMLSQIDENDLSEFLDKDSTAAVVTPQPDKSKVVLDETNNEDVDKEATVDPEKTASTKTNMGAMATILILALGGVAAYYYFKIYKPKKEEDEDDQPEGLETGGLEEVPDEEESEDEDFEEYELTMSVEIRNDKIVSITDITGDGASSNDSYIKRAVNGTSSIKGVVFQIIDKGMPEDIDTVSRATCSSNAILEGCKKVLEAAERPTDMEAE